MEAKVVVAAGRNHRVAAEEVVLGSAVVEEDTAHITEGSREEATWAYAEAATSIQEGWLGRHFVGLERQRGRTNLCYAAQQASSWAEVAVGRRRAKPVVSS